MTNKAGGTRSSPVGFANAALELAKEMLIAYANPA